MGIFEDRTERLEKKVRELEDKMDKVGSSISTLAHVLTQLSEERKGMEKENEALVRANRKLLALVPEDRNKLPKSVFRKYIVPFVKENAELVKMSADKNVSLLFDEIVDKGKVDVKSIARKLDVHEAQIEEWGGFLENNGLAVVDYENGRAVAIRKSF